MDETKISMKTVVGVVRVSTITGKDVYDIEGHKFGEIVDIVLDETSAQTEFAILNVGGMVSGNNQRYYPIPWRLLKFNEARQEYSVHFDHKILTDAPLCEISETGLQLENGSTKYVYEYYSKLSVSE